MPSVKVLARTAIVLVLFGVAAGLATAWTGFVLAAIYRPMAPGTDLTTLPPEATPRRLLA